LQNVVEWHRFRNKHHVFKDRLQAGTFLATELEKQVKENTALLALPAGGIPVGYAISKCLGIPLGVAVVRKIQVPWNTEAGFGAVAWDGSVVLNDALLKELDLTSSQVKDCIFRTKQIVSERIQKFSVGSFPEIGNRTVVLVDDGLASGYTMMVAIDSVKRRGPQRIIVAVPTGSDGAIQLLSSKVDLLICLNIRAGPVFAVADAYEEWYDLADEEVIHYLQK
jgi:putative phosphoribosyl transferase